MINNLKDMNISSLCTVFQRSFAPVYIINLLYKPSVSFLPTFLVQKTPNLSKIDFYVLEHNIVLANLKSWPILYSVTIT